MINQEDLERAIKYGIEWLEDEYLDARDRAFIEIALEALEQMPVTTTAGEGGVIYYPQVEGVTPTVIDAGKQEPFDEYGNYKYPSDFELTEPNTATSMPCGDAIDRKLVCAFIDGLISDDSEREKGLEYIRNMPPVNPTKTGQYEKHIDHTDCIWYGNDSGCPVTCSQYRDGWNDAMDYIFKNGKGYQPYRHDG